MSSPKIDPSARVSAKAELGPGVEVGPYAIIGDGVVIGADTRIGPHCVIAGPTVIGERNLFTGQASIGSDPQDHSYRGEPTRLEIGDDNTVREFVTINRGTLKEDGVTKVGNHNLIMAYCHVAHDCVVGSNVTMSNLATLAGHVRIADNVIIGGLSAIHQFCRVGSYAIVGGGTMVSLDIVPYAKASGDRARIFGTNSIGLKRGGFAAGEIANISKAYRLLFKEGLLLKDAIEKIEADLGDKPEVQRILTFLKESKRGIAR